MKSVLILLAIFFAVRALKKRLEPQAGRMGAPGGPPPPPPPREKQAPGPAQPAEELVLDPVCGSYVPVSSAVEATAGGKKVHFCSEECRDRYQG